MSITEQSPSTTAGKNRPTPKRPRQRVSGNPAKRAQDAVMGAQQTAEAPVAPGRPIWLFVVLAGIIFALTTGFTVATMLLPASTDSFVLISLLTLPALLTMTFVPQARTRGVYRWPVAWILGFTSMYPLPMLVVAQSWVLIRYWLVEYNPRLPRRAPKAD